MPRISDIQPQWLGLIRRLQSASYSVGNKGYAIVQINVLVDKEGKPLIWSEPKVTRLEPNGRTEEFLSAFCEF